MEIKMPIKFHGSYQVVVRSQVGEKKERCQKLTISDLEESQGPGLSGDARPADSPTHRITFYDFGCKRIIEGVLKENEEDRVVFQVQDKQYQFSPFSGPLRQPVGNL